MDTLIKVRQILDNIDDINCGGCGVAALAIYRWLKKNNLLFGGEEIVFLYCWEDSVFKCNDKVFKGEREPAELEAPSHIVLNIEGTFIDSTFRTNETLTERYQAKHLGVTEDILLKTINNIGSWNDMFEREYNVPFIESSLGINLKDVILSH
jgi:hypothetical protein